MSGKENSSTLANRVHTKLPTTIKSSHDQNEKANQFKQSLVDFGNRRKQTQNSYEKVISALESLVEDLFQKIDCLNQDRHVLLKENNDLKRKVESLSNIIEVKQRLGQSVVVENSEIFEIIFQSSSVAGLSRTEYSLQFGNTVGNIMQENEQIVNRQQFIIMSNPLSQNISQIEEGQISMSNIGGRTQTIHPTNMQTPELPRENIFIQCPSTKAEGVIRAFYLSVMQKQFTTNHLLNIVQSLTNDITMVIFEAYPTNHFWTEMLCNFLKIVREQHFDNQMEVLQYIKAHRLIDTLLIRCLKSRIEFLFYNADSFEMPSIQQILGALSNQFGLKMQICDGQYIFYSKQIKDQNLLLSDRASVEISLNNKEDNKFYIRQDEPCFIIMERADYLQFPFYISAETMLGISQYQLNQANENQHSFKYSEENGYSLHLRDTEIQMSRGQDNLQGVVDVLNQKDLNSDPQEQKQLNRIYRHTRERYENRSPQYKQPLSSSRYFLSRVGSKNSCFDENA